MKLAPFNRLILAIVAAALIAAAPLLGAPGASAPLPATSKTPARSATAPATNRFIRFVADPQGGGTLESSINTYRNAAGATVSLVAAVHVADHAYYATLAHRFNSYDCVLYEMIKPRGMATPAPGQARGKLTAVQRWLKGALGLDFQLDDIDYRRKGFINADLDYQTFRKLSDQRGEGVVGLMMRAVGKQMTRDANGKPAREPTPADLAAALANPDSARQLKLALAREFADIETLAADLDGPRGSVIVSERDKVCLDALTKQLSAGKKNIAIFFGAAHLPDMEKHLTADMGFKLVSTQWIIAWDMRQAPAAKR